MFVTCNVSNKYIKLPINVDIKILNIDQLFLDKFKMLSKDNVLVYILVLNPPRVVLLKNKIRSAEIISVGGIDAYIGQLIHAYANVTFEYVTFTHSLYLVNSSVEFKRYSKKYLEISYVANVSPIKVHLVNNTV